MVRAALLVTAWVSLASGCCDSQRSGQERPREGAAPPQAAASAVPPEARALLDDLKEGDTLAGLPVTRLSGPERGVISVEVARGAVRFSIMIVRSGTSPPEHPPPIRTAHYEISVGMISASDANISVDDMLPAARAVEARVRRREDAVSTPPGL
jgi:hypothetical protein